MLASHPALTETKSADRRQSVAHADQIACIVKGNVENVQNTTEYDHPRLPHEAQFKTAGDVLNLVSTAGKSENFLDLTMASIDLPTIVTDNSIDANGPVILKVNHAFEKMCGYQGREICGKSPKILQGPETSLSAASTFRSDLEANGYAITDLVNYRKDGSPYEVMLLGARLDLAQDAPGKSKYFMCFAFKLTEAPNCLPIEGGLV